MSNHLVRTTLIEAVRDFLTANSTITTDQGTFQNLPVLDGENISWENRKFDPKGKNFYASVFYVPNNPEGRTIGEGGFDEMTGFVQIDFNSRIGQGTAEHTEWEEKSALYFITGRNFSRGGNSVIVISAGMSQGRVVDSEYRKSLTIAFRSHLKRHITQT